jgi:metal-sulfur cluster biosynthetic enzyme
VVINAVQNQQTIDCPAPTATSRVNLVADMDEQIKLQIIENLKSVYDPEIPVNIYDLGLIYDLTVTDNDVKIVMTLTSAFCPSAEEIPEETKVQVQKALEMLNINRTVSVDVVFDPPWTPDRVSGEARLEMGMYDYDQENSRLDPWQER